MKVGAVEIGSVRVSVQTADNFWGWTRKGIAQWLRAGWSFPLPATWSIERPGQSSIRCAKLGPVAVSFSVEAGK